MDGLLYQLAIVISQVGLFQPLRKFPYSVAIILHENQKGAQANA